MIKQFIAQNINRGGDIETFNFWIYATLRNNLSVDSVISMEVYITFITDQGEVDVQNYFTDYVDIPVQGSATAVSEGSWVAIPIKAKEITGIILDFDAITSSATLAQYANCGVSIMDQSSGGQSVNGTVTNIPLNRSFSETIIFNEPYNLKDSSTFIELPFLIDIYY